MGDDHENDKEKKCPDEADKEHEEAKSECIKNDEYRPAKEFLSMTFKEQMRVIL